MRYCPTCGQEYIDSASVCADCGVALAQDPPSPRGSEPPPEWVELETVLATPYLHVLLAARAALEAAGIPCFTRGELIQGLFGWGGMPTGINQATGPMLLQVPKDRRDEARSVLEAGAAGPEPVEPTSPESPAEPPAISAEPPPDPPVVEPEAEPGRSPSDAVLDPAPTTAPSRRIAAFAFIAMLVVLGVEIIAKTSWLKGQGTAIILVLAALVLGYILFGRSPRSSD